jgi:general secretion pathway protein G
MKAQLVLVCALPLLWLPAGATGQASDATATSMVRRQIENLGSGLDMFKLDVGHYPTTGQGLRALMVKPLGMKNWQGPYFSHGIPSSPWGGAWIYRSPSRRPGREYDLCTVDGEGRTICNDV